MSKAIPILCLLLAGCVMTKASNGPVDGPYVLVLGTAQDGGFPQIGSYHERARAARADPRKRRLVSSLLLADARTGKRWLIDATPDIREQVDLAQGHPATRRVAGPRPPLFDGIFLTHAHMGHYTGLIHLGREAYGARNVPVHASARMARFLETNAPWSLLVRLGNIELHTLEPGRRLKLGAELEVEPIWVPHRGEFTDTLAFVIHGPKRSLLYIPDIDKWEQWDRRIEDVLAEVDVALLDGTFFANGEIPGRDMSEIPHPFIEESLRRLAPLAASERAKVHFTHLNHSNPATDEGGTAWLSIREAGCAVAREGQIFEL